VDGKESEGDIIGVPSMVSSERSSLCSLELLRASAVAFTVEKRLYMGPDRLMPSKMIRLVREFIL
jgi:hypothetical protein